jgi:hypothetical protein
MRRFPRGMAVRRMALPAVLLAVLGAAPYGGDGGAADRAEEGENQITFARRWTADLHGGLTRIGNSAVTCDDKRDQYRIEDAGACASAREAEGRNIYNNNYQMTGRPRSSATLALPAGSRIAHARLYWGGTNGLDTPGAPATLTDAAITRIGLQAPNGLKTVVAADSPVGRSRGEVDYAYQASADVTALVTAAGAGAYTVSDLGVVAAPYSYGGWTLVVAYQNAAAPRRRLTLYDGYRSVLPGTPVAATLDRVKDQDSVWPWGRLGYVAYDGDRTLTGDQASVKAPHAAPLRLHDPGNPQADLMNSTADGITRDPADRNTFGWDADEFDITQALWPGDASLRLTFSTTDDGDGYQIGVIYTQTDL